MQPADHQYFASLIEPKIPVLEGFITMVVLMFSIGLRKTFVLVDWYFIISLTLYFSHLEHPGHKGVPISHITIHLYGLAMVILTIALNYDNPEILYANMLIYHNLIVPILAFLQQAIINCWMRQTAVIMPSPV